jgi:hypothetical protein
MCAISQGKTSFASLFIDPNSVGCIDNHHSFQYHYTMKRGHYIAFVLIGLFCIVVFGPFFTIHQIRSGIKENDTEKISDNVNFEQLHQNLKDQLSVQTLEEMQTPRSGASKLGLGLSTLFMGAMVDKMVTPGGLVMMMNGKQTGLGIAAPAVAPGTDPFSNVRYSFDSINRFSAYVPDKKGKEIRFVLSRDWLNWRVTNIVLPKD